MIVHRKCRDKVGNFCGWKDNAKELYEKWREQVRERKINDCLDEMVLSL